MNINWYPGHMKKTRESIKKNLPMVDIVFELIDARIPYSSANPIINDLLGDKPRIIILNKSDLANSKGNAIWQKHYSDLGFSSVLLNSITKKGIDKLIDLSDELTKEKKENYAKRGVINKKVRAMIIGIPNVGKSTLINSISMKKGTKTGNRPGITKMNQWIKTGPNIELLDTPGILWPKFEEEKVALNLAFTGAIKDEILDTETLALKLVEKLKYIYPEKLTKRYKLDIKNDSEALNIMIEIGKNRGCIIRGGEIDFSKTSKIILDEFRKGIIGNITLEFPEDR
jgi:ribosome biogenesis GTPase A